MNPPKIRIDNWTRPQNWFVPHAPTGLVLCFMEYYQRLWGCAEVVLLTIICFLRPCLLFGSYGYLRMPRLTLSHFLFNFGRCSFWRELFTYIQRGLLIIPGRWSLGGQGMHEQLKISKLDFTRTRPIQVDFKKVSSNGHDFEAFQLPASWCPNH